MDNDDGIYDDTTISELCEMLSWEFDRTITFDDIDRWELIEGASGRSPRIRIWINEEPSPGEVQDDVKPTRRKSTTKPKPRPRRT